MATDVIRRSVKGSALTHAEMDQNLESMSMTVDNKTLDYTVLVTDQNKLIEMNGASLTLTLCTVATAAGADTDSFHIWVKNIHTSALTVDGNGAETIDGAASITLLEDEGVLLSLSGGGAEWTILATTNASLLGITSTATEINYNDLTTGPGTAEASRAVVLDGSADVTGINSLTSTTLLGTTITGTTVTGTTINQGANNVVDDADIGVTVQAYDAQLADIAALAVTDGNIIVGDGVNWVAESGATARTSLGLGSISTQASSSVTITGGSITGVTDIAIADGGTGASTAAAALDNLGIDGSSGNVAAGDIATGAIGSNKLTNAVTEINSGTSIGSAATVSVTDDGILNINVNGGGGSALVAVEVDFNGTWLRQASSGTTAGAGCGVISDGTNVRIRELNTATGGSYSIQALANT